jgi:hypothetical protein
MWRNLQQPYAYSSYPQRPLIYSRPPVARAPLMTIKEYLDLEFRGSQAPPEQKRLFEFTETEVLKTIHQYKGRTAELDLIRQWIQAGQWEAFLDKYKDDPLHGHHILLAAYAFAPLHAKNRLSIKQLSTAFYFLSAAMDDKDYKIHRLGNKPLGNDVLDLLEVDLTSIEAVSEQVAISVRADCLIQQTQDYLDGIIGLKINVNGTPGIYKGFYEEGNRYYMTSFSIVEQLQGIDERTPVIPQLGESPRKAYVGAICRNEQPYALVVRSSSESVHGTLGPGSSLWHAMHDWFHVKNRMYYDFSANIYMPVLMDELEKLLDERKADKLAQIILGYTTPPLAKLSTPEEAHAALVTKIILEVEGAIAGAESGQGLLQYEDEEFTESTNEELIAALTTDFNYVIQDRIMRQLGWKSREEYEAKAHDFKMFEIQNAMGRAFDLVKAPFLKAIDAKREMKASPLPTNSLK